MIDLRSAPLGEVSHEGEGEPYHGIGPVIQVAGRRIADELVMTQLADAVCKAAVSRRQT
jgi:hypothetical protein